MEVCADRWTVLPPAFPCLGVVMLGCSWGQRRVSELILACWLAFLVQMMFTLPAFGGPRVYNLVVCCILNAGQLIFSGLID